MTSDRADKSDLGDQTPRGRDPGELSVAANERERVLAENAEQIRRLGKRAVGDVIEIGRRLTEMKEICGHGNWLPWLHREFGWTDRHALKCMQVYDLSRKSENFSDLRISLSGLYLLAAPSTPSEAVDKVIERAMSGERQGPAEIKGTIDEIKRVKAAAAGIKPQGGKKRTKAVGLTAPEQETIKEWNQMMLKIVSYVVVRDGMVDPNDNEWMLLVGRAKLMYRALMLGLVPIARERWRALANDNGWPIAASPTSSERESKSDL
jgi:hypothetical protein